MEYTIAQIVGALKTNRNEFAELFLQAQYNLSVGDRREFEGVSSGSAEDRAAFTKALEFANMRGFLNEFIAVTAKTSLETGELARLVIEDQNDGSSTLQSIANAAAGFTEPVVYYKGIIKSIRWTGKVLINGQAQGTGVLIGANLFLTAWHVTKTLFDEAGYPLQNIGNLSVEFDNFLDIREGALRPSPSVIIDAHQDWCVSYSKCHDAELMDNIPDPSTGLKDHWDYTIIRLKKALGFERRWAKLDKRVLVPVVNANIILFQHPAGQSLRIDQSRIRDMKPPDPSIPRYRFLHGANANNGSSGGPCFDKEFSLIGIHQGTWPNLLNNEVINRGIPINNILAHVTDTIGNLPVPEPADSPFWCLDKKHYEPIIGCDDFQYILWESALLGQKRLIEIKGNPGTGKSFLVKVASAVLNDSGHLKIILPAEVTGKMNVKDYIQYICTTAGISTPELPSFEESTVTAWLKIVVDLLTGELNQKRNGRLVWICLTNLNEFDIEGQNLSEFLFILYESLRFNDWLRIVLDGMQTGLPSAVVEWTDTYRTREIIIANIEGYLTKGFSELDIDTNNVKNSAKFLYGFYQDELNIDPQKALGVLKRATQRFLQSNL